MNWGLLNKAVPVLKRGSEAIGQINSKTENYNKCYKRGTTRYSEAEWWLLKLRESLRLEISKCQPNYRQ